MIVRIFEAGVVIIVLLGGFVVGVSLGIPDTTPFDPVLACVGILAVLAGVIIWLAAVRSGIYRDPDNWIGHG